MEIASTERSLQLTDQSKAVGLNQQVNEEQPKGMFRRLKTWAGRGFRPKRRHQTKGPIEKQDNHLKGASEYIPVGQNSLTQTCDGSDGNADDTEPTHTDITSSMKSLIRPSDEFSRKSGKGSERTTPFLTNRSLTKATDSTKPKGIESCAPVMAGCVDTLRADSKGGVQSVSARRSDRIADSIHVERDQSSTDSTTPQREKRQEMNRNKSSLNGAVERKGSRSDINRFDVKLASVVRVEVSDDDIRAIAEDSIVPTDGQSIQDFKTRERKLKRLLKDKKFIKVKSGGERRYVRKANGRTSIWSRMRGLLCFKAGEQKEVRDVPNNRLEAQVGREDLTNRRVNKSIGDQHVGPKRKIMPVLFEPPLRRTKSRLPENETKGKDLMSKKEWTPEKVAQYEALKNTFNTMLMERKMLEKELERIREIPDSAFGTLRKERYRELTKDDSLSMSKSVRAVIPLLKTNGITLHQFIGKGGEAYVFHAELKRGEEWRQLAVKVSMRENRDLSREYVNMRGLKHRNVIEFLDIWKKKPVPFIAYEVATGDMKYRYDRFKETSKKLPSLERARYWSTGIVRGLHYVHWSGIMHNDIKMGNILLVKEFSTGRDIPKIADFGLSRRVTKDDSLISGHSKYGTTPFASPECLLLEEVEDMRLMDVWAFGLIVYKLVTDRYPFPLFSSKNLEDPVKLSAAVDRMMRFKVREQLPGLSLITEDERQEIRSLLTLLLEPNVLKRESIDVIAQHSWFKHTPRSQAFNDRRIIE